MTFKIVDLKAERELSTYLDLVRCDACDYSFTTLYMWQHAYNTRYYTEEDFAVVIEEYKDNSLSLQLLADAQHHNKAIKFILDYLGKEDKKIYLRDITNEVFNILNNIENYKFESEKDRDSFEYIYDADMLRSLTGRKNKKRRNHLNAFLNEYKGRYEYRLLGKDDFDECISLMKGWINEKENDHKYDKAMVEELIAIKKVFNAYEVLKTSVKIAGVYIDSKLESFTIGEKLNEDMALIHIEKANPNIRGLYAFINQQFLVNEFADVDFVNREEDLGLEGLREAKLSYHPCRFVEKYIIKEC